MCGEFLKLIKIRIRMPCYKTIRTGPIHLIVTNIRVVNIKRLLRLFESRLGWIYAFIFCIIRS